MHKKTIVGAWNEIHLCIKCIYGSWRNQISKLKTLNNKDEDGLKDHDDKDWKWTCHLWIRWSIVQKDRTEFASSSIFSLCFLRINNQSVLIKFMELKLLNKKVFFPVNLDPSKKWNMVFPKSDFHSINLWGFQKQDGE